MVGLNTFNSQLRGSEMTRIGTLEDYQEFNGR